MNIRSQVLFDFDKLVIIVQDNLISPCTLYVQTSTSMKDYTDLHNWLYWVQRYVYFCGTCQQVTCVEWKQNGKGSCDICNMPYGQVSVPTCLRWYLSLAIQAESRPLGHSSELYRNTLYVNSGCEGEIYVMAWYSV